MLLTFAGLSIPNAGSAVPEVLEPTDPRRGYPQPSDSDKGKSDCSSFLKLLYCPKE